MINNLIDIAQQAAVVINQCYKIFDKTQLQVKPDLSPVTQADRQSHQIIQAALLQLYPEIPVLSEEGVDIDYDVRVRWSRYWLIDPLDGTKEFINGFDDFTINIALIENNQPKIGVVLLPVSGICYFAIAGDGSYKKQGENTPQKIQVQTTPSDPLRITTSRHHVSKQLQAFLSGIDNHEIVTTGSALKFCLVAEGQVDLYPRLGPTCEWDTAAGQCVLEQAGGCVLDQYKKPLRYNTAASLINPHFIATTPALADYCQRLS